MSENVKIKVSNEDVAQVTTTSAGTSKADYDKFAIGNNPNAETRLYVKGLKNDYATITFRDSADVKIGTATLSVEVSENTDLNEFELKLDSDISTTDVTNVGKALYQKNNFNKARYFRIT